VGSRGHRWRDCRAYQRGFTLFELLVVIAIICLITALVPGFMFRSQPRLDVSVAARAIADGLRQTRSDALASNRPQVFALDVAEHLFRTGDATPVRINRAIVLSFRTARAELQGDGVGQIRYFPDGSSTGGQITLARQGWQADVRSDWLTGLVSVDVTAQSVDVAAQ
jgi:general secretion pathway protein H